MRSPFLAAAVIAFVVTLAGAGVVGLVAAQLLAPPAPLPRFISDTFEFTLAPAWTCDLDETEYVCWKGRPPHEAIAIIAMKRRGPEDNLVAYEKHLSTPQLGSDGVLSTIRSVEHRTLAGHEWIEAVHESSELRNYVTIYLAAATSHVGVLATFSFHRDYEQAVRRDMEIMMSSLNIHQQGL
jgi:hypothetical protein